MSFAKQEIWDSYGKNESIQKIMSLPLPLFFYFEHLGHVNSQATPKHSASIYCLPCARRISQEREFTSQQYHIGFGFTEGADYWLQKSPLWFLFSSISYFNRITDHCCLGKLLKLRLPPFCLLIVIHLKVQIQQHKFSTLANSTFFRPTPLVCKSVT